MHVSSIRKKLVSLRIIWRVTIIMLIIFNFHLYHSRKIMFFFITTDRKKCCKIFFYCMVGENDIFLHNFIDKSMIKENVILVNSFRSGVRNHACYLTLLLHTSRKLKKIYFNIIHLTSKLKVKIVFINCDKNILK